MHKPRSAATPTGSYQLLGYLCVLAVLTRLLLTTNVSLETIVVLLAPSWGWQDTPRSNGDASIGSRTPRAGDTVEARRSRHKSLVERGWVEVDLHGENENEDEDENEKDEAAWEVIGFVEGVFREHGALVLAELQASMPRWDPDVHRHDWWEKAGIACEEITARLSPRLGLRVWNSNLPSQGHRPGR